MEKQTTADFTFHKVE